MKVRIFVISGACLLTLWLALVFMHQPNIASYGTAEVEEVAEGESELAPIEIIAAAE